MLSENQHATYIVYDEFNYYMEMKPTSSVKFVSNNGTPININFNIWCTEDGAAPKVEFSCQVNNKNGFGIKPTAQQLVGLPQCTYDAKIKRFEEVIPPSQNNGPIIAPHVVVPKKEVKLKPHKMICGISVSNSDIKFIMENGIGTELIYLIEMLELGLKYPLKNISFSYNYRGKTNTNKHQISADWTPEYWKKTISGYRAMRADDKLKHFLNKITMWLMTMEFADSFKNNPNVKQGDTIKMSCDPKMSRMCIKPGKIKVCQTETSFIVENVSFKITFNQKRQLTNEDVPIRDVQKNT